MLLTEYRTNHKSLRILRPEAQFVNKVCVSPHKGGEIRLIIVYKGGALYRRAPPLEKQSAGLFFNSPLAELLNAEGVSRSAERDEGRCPSTLQAFEKA